MFPNPICLLNNCELNLKSLLKHVQNILLIVGLSCTVDACLLCRDRHWTDGCPTFKTYDEPIKAAQGKSYICLRETHKTGDCSSMKCCVHCGGSRIHHRNSM